MNAASFQAVLAAEWTKIRSVRSTAWTLLLTVTVGVGLGYLIGLSFNVNFDRMEPAARQSFDPLFATFLSLTLAQLPLVVFAVLVVGAEYTSGTIRATLAAVPRRGALYCGKVLTGALPIAVISVITVLVTFGTAQAGLGPHATSIGADGTLPAAFGACLYLTLIGLFATGVAAMLRSPVITLAILLPLFFLGSQGLGNIPKIKTVTQYLPDQAGMVIMHLAGPPEDPRFGRDYGPWTGLGILLLWTAAALVGGYLVLRRRDA